MSRAEAVQRANERLMAMVIAGDPDLIRRADGGRGEYPALMSAMLRIRDEISNEILAAAMTRGVAA